MKMGKMWALASLLAAVSGTASAALVTLNGNGWDMTYDDTTVGLFGAPTLSGDGNTILFSPLAFRAESNGAGIQTVSQVFQWTLSPVNASTRVAQVKLIENGDYRLDDIFPVANSPRPVVNASGELRLTNLETGNQTVAETFDTGNLFAPLGATTLWDIEATTFAPADWGVVDVRVGLQNNLLAGAFALTQAAFIQKKHASNTIGLEVVTQAVPVPAAIWLLGSALGAMGVMGRRDKSAK